MVESYDEKLNVNMKEKAEGNVEGISQVVGLKDNSEVTAPSLKMNDGI